MCILSAAEAMGQVVLDCNRHDHKRLKQAEQLEAQGKLKFLRQDSSRTRAVKTDEPPTSGSGISHVEALAALGLSPKAGGQVSPGFQAAARRKIEAWPNT